MSKEHSYLFLWVAAYGNQRARVHMEPPTENTIWKCDFCSLLCREKKAKDIAFDSLDQRSLFPHPELM